MFQLSFQLPLQLSSCQGDVMINVYSTGCVMCIVQQMRQVYLQVHGNM
jgi:hypothetical protein